MHDKNFLLYGIVTSSHRMNFVTSIALEMLSSCQRLLSIVRIFVKQFKLTECNTHHNVQNTFSLTVARSRHGPRNDFIVGVARASYYTKYISTHIQNIHDRPWMAPIEVFRGAQARPAPPPTSSAYMAVPWTSYKNNDKNSFSSAALAELNWY